MSFASEILGRRMGLPEAETRDVICERDLSGKMDDGVTLIWRIASSPQESSGW